MKRANVIIVLGFTATAGVGCNADGLTVPPAAEADAAAQEDIAVSSGDASQPPDEGPDCPEGPWSECCHCNSLGLGPDKNKPFPLPTDPARDPSVDADGVGRDRSGFLVLAPTRATFHYAWLALDGDGTVARLDTRTMKEVGRYRTTTCFSLPSGGKQPCDGAKGCCAADSDPQWQQRRKQMPEGTLQAVQLVDNSPSRVAVDVNGDAFVANRALGGQASITKIAGDLGGCRDRNKNGRIDTSSDVDGDGRIDPTDPKEFLGLDDECVLWTTNHGPANSIGRPLALGPGASGTGSSDAFAGGFETGTLYRIDGATGKLSNQWQLPGGCQPWGLAIDALGFGWAVNHGPGSLCYLDTRKSENVGVARGTMDGYGISLDRDQNIWVGGGVARYTPDRSKGFASLGLGYWTRIAGLAGYGVAADSRSSQRYFVWSATTANALLRIPASDIPRPQGMDATVAWDPSWPKLGVASLGIGLDASQNLIAVPSSSVVTCVRVDANGDFVQPDLTSPPKMGERCPAGDRCDLGSHVYTYSDFASFGLRDFTVLAGSYSYVINGLCTGDHGSTNWLGVDWDADQPPGTSIAMHARSGPSATPDPEWGAWTTDFRVSPVDLSPPGVLVPNGPAQKNANALKVEFTFRSSDRNATPRLRALEVWYKCEPP